MSVLHAGLAFIALSAFFISFTSMVTLWIVPVNLDFASEPIASTTGKDTDNRSLITGSSTHSPGCCA